MDIGQLQDVIAKLQAVADQEANEGFTIRASEIRNGAVALTWAAMRIGSLETSLIRAHERGAADARSRDFAARYGHEMGQ